MMIYIADIGVWHLAAPAAEATDLLFVLLLVAWIFLSTVASSPLPPQLPWVVKVELKKWHKDMLGVRRFATNGEWDHGQQQPHVMSEWVSV